jgi:hypothetical protein
MDVHGIRVSPYNLPSAKQYEDLIHSLRVLAATVDNNRGVPQQNIDAVERFEARFFRDAHPVKEKLISFLAKFDGDYCARRPNIYQSGCDAEELVRDVNGEVIHLTSPIHMQELAPLHPLLVTRMLILVHLNLACLFWFLAGFVSSHFGEYQTQVKFTLVGLCLGLRKQVLGMPLKKHYSRPYHFCSRLARLSKASTKTKLPYAGVRLERLSVRAVTISLKHTSKTGLTCMSASARSSSQNSCQCSTPNWGLVAGGPH